MKVQIEKTEKGYEVDATDFTALDLLHCSAACLQAAVEAATSDHEDTEHDPVVLAIETIQGMIELVTDSLESEAAE